MSLKLTLFVCRKMMQRRACPVAFVFALVRHAGQDEACDPATLHDLCKRLPMSAVDAARKILSVSTRSTKIECEEFSPQTSLRDQRFSTIALRS